MVVDGECSNSVRYFEEMVNGIAHRYALERTTTYLKVWFWARDDATVPADVQTLGATANPDDWVRSSVTFLSQNLTAPPLWQGTPTAFFPNTQCDIEKIFKKHNIIINLTLCLCYFFMLIPF